MHAHLLAGPGDGLWRQLKRRSKTSGAADAGFIVAKLARAVELMNRAYRAELRVWRVGAVSLAKMRFDQTQKDMQDGADGLRFPALDSITDASAARRLFDGRAVVEKMIDQVGSGLRHPSGVERGTRPASLAGQGDQEIVPAVRAMTAVAGFRQRPQSRYRQDLRSRNAGTA